MLGVFRAGLGKRQHERENRNDEGDRAAFFLGLNGGVAGFGHRQFPPSGKSGAFFDSLTPRGNLPLFFRKVHDQSGLLPSLRRR
jgi:hypothetical protein